jgi:hypothetical protein
MARFKKDGGQPPPPSHSYQSSPLLPLSRARAASGPPAGDRTAHPRALARPFGHSFSFRFRTPQIPGSAPASRQRGPPGLFARCIPPGSVWRRRAGGPSGRGRGSRPRRALLLSGGERAAKIGGWSISAAILRTDSRAAMHIIE